MKLMQLHSNMSRYINNIDLNILKERISNNKYIPVKLNAVIPSSKHPYSISNDLERISVWKLYENT